MLVFSFSSFLFPSVLLYSTSLHFRFPLLHFFTLPLVRRFWHVRFLWFSFLNLSFLILFSSFVLPFFFIPPLVRLTFDALILRGIKAFSSVLSLPSPPFKEPRNLSYGCLSLLVQFVFNQSQIATTPPHQVKRNDIWSHTNLTYPLHPSRCTKYLPPLGSHHAFNSLCLSPITSVDFLILTLTTASISLPKACMFIWWCW